MSWLDPKVIDSAKALELVAKSLAKGRLQGRHRSQRLSNGYEFSQYRPYVQGDDLRLIDWKMYGKTDKYYIKQSEVERDHDLHIIFDNSKSMDYEEGGWSKLLYAKLLAACLSHVVIQQGDSFSWSSTDSRYKVGQGMQHWRNSIHAMHALQATQKDGLNIVAEQNKVYLWITDLYHTEVEVNSIISNVKSSGNELIVFHLIGEQEEALEFPNNSTFIDLESGEKIQMNPKEYVAEYKSKIDKHLKLCKDIFNSKKIQYHKSYINRPVDESIKLFLNSYAKLQS